MKYTFDIVGVSSVLHFFNHQQQSLEHQQHGCVEYLPNHICTLDAFLETVEILPRKRGWDMDQIVDTVINFWLNNAESIQYWKNRLQDAGKDNLLVTRLADINSLQAEFEILLGKNW